MLDKDFLKSDSSSDEKTYYADERVRRRFKRREFPSTAVPELESIVTRVAKTRPAPTALATHKTPLFRTQSDSIFDAISRENFELRRENEELKLELERVQEHLRKQRKHAKERSKSEEQSMEVAHTEAKPAQKQAQQGQNQPEWVPAFFEALTNFLKDNQPQREPEHVEEPEQVEDPAKEIISVVRDLQSTLKELASAASANVAALRASEEARIDAIKATGKGLSSGAANSASRTPTHTFTDPAAHATPVSAQSEFSKNTPFSVSRPRTETMTPHRLDPVAPEIINALRELKIAVSRPVSVTLEPSKALAEMFAHEMAQEVPALSSSSSTIEHEHEHEQEPEQEDHAAQFVSDEARKFLEQLRETDPKQYHQVLENIQRKVDDGDSTQFQEFVHDRLGLA